jgi:hypothetical protein
MTKTFLFFELLMVIAVNLTIIPGVAAQDKSAIEKYAQLYPVYLDEKWGFIDYAGQMMIEPRFDDLVSNFSEGLCNVFVGNPKTEEGKWGFIDETGKYVIEPMYDDAWEFHEGLAAVEEGIYYGYIDTSGNWVIDPQYVMSFGFSEGLAMVWVDEGQIVDDVNEDVGFIDKTGTMVIGPSFTWASDFHEGLASVQVGKQDKLYEGYIDKTGKFITQFTFESCDDISEGMGAVKFPGGHVGYVDTNGLPVIEQVWVYYSSFSEGLATVGIQGKFGYIDKTGHYTIEPMYRDAGSFSEGLAYVKIGSKYGYIDKTGNVVIKRQFDYAGSFSNGLALAGFSTPRAKRLGYIDMSGKFVWGPVTVPADFVWPDY